MLTKELQATLYLAVAEAKQRRHEYLTLEHVLLAMLKDDAARKILLGCGADIESLLKDLEQYFAENVDSLPEGQTQDPLHTPAFQRVLQRAATQVQGSGKQMIDVGNLLAAFFREPSSHAVFFLEKQGVSRLDVISYLSHGSTKIQMDGELVIPGDEEQGYERGEETESNKNSILETFTCNLNIRAKEGGIDPLVGRQLELERTIQVLCRRRKNNPLFVGDSGVGKTAIAEGLALRLVEGQVPEILRDATIYALDMGALVAGTKYRGEFEARLKRVLSLVKKSPNSILFIDEIHTIIGAGATSGGSLDASNLLKPALASGQLRCIGSTTYNDYKTFFEKDHALTRRFQKIDVLEPSVSETYEILKGLRRHYEEHHNVKYSTKALHTAAELSAKYINDRKLPDKAIDVIDEAGAWMRIQQRIGLSINTVHASDIEHVVARV